VPTPSSRSTAGIGNGQRRYKFTTFIHVWFDADPKPLGNMRVDIPTAKMALRLLTEGMSWRDTKLTRVDIAEVGHSILMGYEDGESSREAKPRGITAR